MTTWNDEINAWTRRTDAEAAFTNHPALDAALVPVDEDGVALGSIQPGKRWNSARDGKPAGWGVQAVDADGDDVWLTPDGWTPIG